MFFSYSKETPEDPLAYNSIDKSYNVNRVSYTGDYMVEHGRPRYDISKVIS